jgi:hypothetical protein
MTDRVSSRLRDTRRYYSVNFRLIIVILSEAKNLIANLRFFLAPLVRMTFCQNQVV